MSLVIRRAFITGFPQAMENLKMRRFSSQGKSQEILQFYQKPREMSQGKIMENKTINNQINAHSIFKNSCFVAQNDK